MLKMSMDAFGLLQSLSSNGIKFDFSKVYSISAGNNATTIAIDAGIYLIFFSGVYSISLNSQEVFLSGNLIMSSSDSNTIYCATKNVYFQFTNPTTIKANASAGFSSLAVSLIGIKTE